MSRTLSLTTALVGAALGLACGTDPVPVEPSGADGPALRSAHSPPGPGAFVIRTEGTFGFYFSDPDERYSVLGGLSRDQLAALCSGADFTFEPAREQLVFRPDGSIHQIFRARRVTVHVFEGAFADICGTPFAVGQGNYTNTDNDLAVSFRRTNSFGFRLRGQVTDGSGGRHHLLAKFRALIMRSGLFRELFSEIKLN
jgi:hypothetical protein